MLTKDFLKRFLALACALVLVLGLSVSSFALSVTNYTVSQLSENARNFLEAVTDNGIYQVNVCLDDHPDNVKDAWKTVMGSWLNNPDYYVLFSLTSSVFKVTAGSKSSFFLSLVPLVYFFPVVIVSLSIFMAMIFANLVFFRTFLLLFLCLMAITFIVLLMPFFRILSFLLFLALIKLYLILIHLLSMMISPRMNRIPVFRKFL